MNLAEWGIRMEAARAGIAVAAAGLSHIMAAMVEQTRHDFSIAAGVAIKEIGMNEMFRFNEETGQFETTEVPGLLSIDIASEEWQRAIDGMDPAAGPAPYGEAMVVDWNLSPSEQPDFDMIDHLQELMKQCRVQSYRVDRCDTIEEYVGRQSVPPTLAELLERFPLYDNFGRLGLECWQRGLGFYGAGVMDDGDGMMTFTLTAATRVFVVEYQLLWWLDATGDVADNLRGVSDA